MEKVKIISTNGLEDSIESKIGINHIDALIEMADKYKINYNSVNPNAILKSFIKNNYIILLNIGLLDGKITYTVAIPKNLSNEQINFMEKEKEYFYEKCDFIGIYVDCDEKTEYNDDIRDLILENKIYNLKFKNRMDILYNEIESQKRNSKH